LPTPAGRSIPRSIPHQQEAGQLGIELVPEPWAGLRSAGGSGYNKLPPRAAIDTLDGSPSHAPIRWSIDGRCSVTEKVLLVPGLPPYGENAERVADLQPVPLIDLLIRQPRLARRAVRAAGKNGEAPLSVPDETYASPVKRGGIAPSQLVRVEAATQETGAED